jgi:hypothetical protein
MGPFLYLTISMTSPPWFSFMGGEMTMVFIAMNMMWVVKWRAMK